jgi:hypothetical protein
MIVAMAMHDYFCWNVRPWKNAGPTTGLAVECRPTKSHSLGVILTPGAFTFSTQFIPTLCSTYLYWSYGNLTPSVVLTLRAMGMRFHAYTEAERAWLEPIAMDVPQRESGDM